MKLLRDALLAPPDDRLLPRSLLNFILSISVSLALVAGMLGVGMMLGCFPTPPESSDLEISVLGFFGAVLFSPIVETLLLSGLLAILSLMRRSVPTTAVISACIWGGLHGLVAPFWFVGTVFGFFVFSCAYLTWRPKSFRHAFAAAALPHAMQNLVAFSLVCWTEGS